MITNNLSVVGLLNGDDLIGYRLHTNSNDNYDVHKSTFEDICDGLNLSLDVLECKKMYEVSSGIFNSDNDDSIELKDEYLIKLLLNDIGKINLGMVSKTGNSLSTFIDKVSSYKERYCMSDIVSFLESDKCNILTLYGVRRTGKTILLYQIIKKLKEAGVSLNDIYFLSLSKDSISSDDLYCYVSAILNSNVKYLLIDEVTYCKDSIDFTSIFAEKFVDNKIIMAGTDSAVFIEPMSSFLYDRVDLVHTSYISFKEFNYLYDLALKDYINNGGILKSSTSYESTHYFDIERYVNLGLDYFSTSIIDNMFSCFEKYDMSKKFPELQELYFKDKNLLRVMIIKWIQMYGSELSLSILRRSFKSDDVGNLKDVCRRRLNFSPDKLNKFINKFESLFEQYIDYKDSVIFTSSQIKELKSFLRSIDCLIKVNFTNNEFIVPLMIRYGLYCEAILVLNENYDNLSTDLGSSFDFNLFQEIILNCLEGVIYEGVLFTDLYKSGKRFRKYRDDNGREIDLVIDSNLYEIKHSNKIIAGQCRWLLNDDFVSSLQPKSFNVIYSGSTKDVYFSQRDAVKSIIDSRKVHNKKLEDEYKSSSTVKKLIHYINIDEFLLNI